MEYDFYGLCDDQNIRLQKRLDSLQKSSMKEYELALNIINDPSANEKRPDIRQELEDALYTASNKAMVAYQECSIKVIAIMKQHL